MMATTTMDRAAAATAMPGVTGHAGYFDGHQPYALEERHWGYVIRSLEPVSPWVLGAQAVAWIGGIVAAVAALALWVSPSDGEAPLLIRLGLCAVLGTVAVALLWFASRGVRPEIEVDTNQREVREVVRNRAGRPTLIGRYAFDVIGGVFLDRSAGRGQYRPSQASLVLRYRNTAQIMPVVQGRASDLIALRDRLGRDVMIARQTGRDMTAAEAA